MRSWFRLSTALGKNKITVPATPMARIAMASRPVGTVRGSRNNRSASMPAQGRLRKAFTRNAANSG